MKGACLVSQKRDVMTYLFFMPNKKNFSKKSAKKIVNSQAGKYYFSNGSKYTISVVYNVKLKKKGRKFQPCFRCFAKKTQAWGQKTTFSYK